jgi:membrane dipeptidase
MAARTWSNPSLMHGLSRRDLLARASGFALLALSGGGPALLSGCATSQSPPASEADAELTRLVDAVIGVDMHSHSGGVHFRSAPDINVTEQMRQGRMTAVCLCHTGDGPVIRRGPDNHITTVRTPRPAELWRHTQARLDFFDQMVRAQGLPRVLKVGDLEATHRDRAPAIVQSIEGCQFLEGRVERVAEVHRRGVRQLQLVHFFRSELGDNQTESPDQGGLTALGRQVTTLPAFVDGIARAVDAVGVDHVGLGSDVGGAARNVWPNYAAFPTLVQLLRQKGFKAEEIGKLVGGNYVRVFNASVTSV